MRFFLVAVNKTITILSKVMKTWVKDIQFSLQIRIQVDKKYATQKIFGHFKQLK